LDLLNSLQIERYSLKIDIGCGSSRREGFLGLDILKLPGVDVVHNLNELPHSFMYNQMDEIWMD